MKIKKINSPIIPFFIRSRGTSKRDENKSGFTLVELIVVITILAVLSTIGFVSYSGYLAGTRDTNRTSQLKAISDGLHLFSTNHGLPTPDDKIDVKANSEIIAYQGYAGKNVLETITYSTPGLDPKDKTYFSYYLTKDKKYFQLMAFLEEEDNLQTAGLFNKTKAVDYSIKYPTVNGAKLGILTTNDNLPIQEDSIISGSGYLDISDVGTTEFKSYLKDGEYILGGTGTVFSDLTNIASVGGKYWLVYQNEFVYYDPNAEWLEYDTNCDIGDITIGSQTWAGCNSTLGDGIEFEKNYDNSCYDYIGNNLQTCSDIENLSTAKENAWNSTYGINNIWGKLYLWDNSASACRYGWHVPTDEELYDLEVALGSTDRSEDGTYATIVDGWKSGGLGWSGYTTRSSSNNIIEALQLPLAGYLDSGGTAFSYRGNTTKLWSSSSSDSDDLKAFGRLLYWNSSDVFRDSRSKNFGLSVRCLKN